jgi:hypothetical protein
VDTLHAFVGHLQKPTKPLLRQTLVDVLDGFRAVGLEATGPVVDWLTVVRPDPQDAKAVLFAEGGASGRYLLLQWGDRDEEVADLLRQWERQVLPPLHPEQGSSVLWARERGEPRAVWKGVRRLGLDFDPFGPQKAEQDPRLPDLFYRLPPIWDEVTARQPGIFIASPGSGRSALIWMIRYESELVGSDVEDVFPVFVPLYSLSSLEDLAQVLQKAMATALASVAARNPYALLGLEDVEQQALIELLLRSAGGLSPLLQQLQAAGLSPDDPDGQLLQEAVYVVARTQKTWEGVIEWDMPRFHPYGREHTFLLIDVSFDDPDKVCALLEALFDRWLPFLAPRQVVAKVFLSSEPACCPVAPVWFRWDDGALQQLVQHRMTRAGLVVQEGQPLMDGWVEDLTDPDALLIEKAEGCPKRLVGLGNRLIRRLAQPKPLSRDEFSELLS